jgi:hypothetical protein
MLTLYPADRNILMILLGQLLRVVQARNATHSILVAILSREIVPITRLFDIDRHMDADLVEVAHGKLSSRKAALRRAFSVLVSQLLILAEHVLMPTEEPLAYGHLGLGLALTRSECIVVHGQCRVELASQGAELVRGAHLQLRLRKSQIRRLFDVDPRLLDIIR